ncbi:MAG TPA: hypothetical protein VGC21_19960 [Telluria sp.]|jgi:hypothetical protein
MKQSTKRIGLGLALAATLAASWYDPAPVEALSGASAPRARALPGRAGKARADVSVDVLAIRARNDDDSEQEGGNLFNPTQWNPVTALAAPPPAPVEAMPATQLPPLPFKVLGIHEQAGQTTVFLQQNENNYVVRVGDTIADTYKVESLQGSTLTLRHLPLNQTQTLELGRTLTEK